MPEAKAFLEGYSYDIFISYGRLDDEPLEGNEGWVTHLTRLLSQELSAELGAPVSIFQDEQSQRNGDLDDVIKKAVGSSAFFLAVVTPRFCNSEWCLKELEWFLNTAKPPSENSPIGNRRLFKVIARHVELEEQPRLLRASVGYEFVRRDVSKNIYYNLPLKDLNNTENKAAVEFRRLVRDLQECLSGQSQTGGSTPAPAPSPLDPPKPQPPSPRKHARVWTAIKQKRFSPRAALFLSLFLVLAALGMYRFISPSKRERVLIAAGFWPPPHKDDWDDLFDLTPNGLPDKALWNFEKARWEVLNVPFAGMEGESIVSEGTGSLVITGPGWGTRRFARSGFRGEAYYDYTAVFQVRFLGNAKDVSWLFRADGDHGRGYVFSLVKRNNALFLNGFSQADPASDCLVSGGTSKGCTPLQNSGRLVTNEYIDPTDVFTISATVKGFEFQHCVDFLYTKLQAPDGTARRLVEEDCQTVTPMNDPDQRFRYGSIGFAGPSDGSKAAIEYVKVKF